MYKEKLKFLREQFDVTQKQLAEIIGVQRPVYTQYESEYNTIPLTHLNTICNYFNISIDYILDFNNTMQYSDYFKEIDKIKAGSRLKEFRKENKLTQVKLATYLNTTHTTIVAYEKGKTLIATPFLYTICKKYNISADYLLGKTNNPKYLK